MNSGDWISSRCPGNSNTMTSPRPTLRRAGTLNHGRRTFVNGIVLGVVPPYMNLLTKRKSPAMISFSIDPVGTSNDASTKLFRKKNDTSTNTRSFRKSFTGSFFASRCSLSVDDRSVLAMGLLIRLPLREPPGTPPGGFRRVPPASYAFFLPFVSPGASACARCRRRSISPARSSSSRKSTRAR